MKGPPSQLAAQLRAAGRPGGSWFLLRAAVTLCVLGLLLWWLPLETLRAALGRISAMLWLGCLLAFALGHAVAALKWRTLLKASGVATSTAETLRAHAAGLFANLCLPSLVGGDVLRAGMLVRDHGRAEAIAVASVGDRLLDTLCLLVLAMLGAVAIPATLASETRTALSVVSLLLAVAVTIVAAALFGLPRLPAGRIPLRLAPIAGRVRTAGASLLARPGATLAAFALSLTVQTGFVALNAALGSAIGLSQPFAVWLLAWPLAKLVALVPISLGGIGVREAALASFLLPFAVQPALAVAQSLVWETLLVGLGISAGLAAFWWSPEASGAADATDRPGA